MKRLKQILMVLVSVTMLLAVCAGAASAAGSAATTSREGYTIHYTWYNNEEMYRILDITGQGAMVDYYQESCQGPVSPWAFDTENGLTQSYGVNIGEGITHIGTNAFYRFYNLYEVTLPESLKSIGACAFNSCTYLTSINIPDSVTYIGENALHSSRLTITCSSTSYAYKYAMENGIKVKLTDGCAHSGSRWQMTDATCVADGKKVRVCTECGETLETVIIPAAKDNHTWKTQGTRVKKATVFSPAVYKYSCENCSAVTEKEVGAKLKATLKLNKSSLTLTKKQAYNKLKAAMANGDRLKSVKSSKSSVVKVVGYTKAGTIKLKAMSKTGSAKLTIKTAAGAKKTITIKVKDIATKKITNVASKLTMKKGDSLVLKPILKPTNSTQGITFKSSNKKIVTVSAKGKLVAKKKGTATITVKSGSKSVKCKVTVK